MLPLFSIPSSANSASLPQLLVDAMSTRQSGLRSGDALDDRLEPLEDLVESHDHLPKSPVDLEEQAPGEIAESLLQEPVEFSEDPLLERFADFLDCRRDSSLRIWMSGKSMPFLSFCDDHIWSFIPVPFSLSLMSSLFVS